MDPEKSVDSITQKLYGILWWYGIDYTPLAPSDQQIVYDIFLGKALDLNNVSSYSGDVLNYVWLYFEYVKKDTAIAKKYLLLSIEKGNSNAMYNYGCLSYEEGNIPEAKKFYRMAIEKGNSNAIYDYAMLMQKEGNIPEAKKYLRLGMDKGDQLSFRKLHKIYINEYCKKTQDVVVGIGIVIDSGVAIDVDTDADFLEFLKISYKNTKFKGKLCPIFRGYAKIYISLTN